MGVREGVSERLSRRLCVYVCGDGCVCMRWAHNENTTGIMGRINSTGNYYRVRLVQNGYTCSNSRLELGYNGRKSDKNKITYKIIITVSLYLDFCVILHCENNHILHYSSHHQISAAVYFTWLTRYSKLQNAPHPLNCFQTVCVPSV